MSNDLAVAAARVARAIGLSVRYGAAWPVEDAGLPEIEALRQIAERFHEYPITGTDGKRVLAEGFGRDKGVPWHVTVEYDAED